MTYQITRESAPNFTLAKRKKNEMEVLKKEMDGLKKGMEAKNDGIEATWKI